MTKKEYTWAFSYFALCAVAIWTSGCIADPSGTQIKDHSLEISDEIPDEGETLEPPKFNYGDVVSLGSGDSVQIGVVVSHQRYDFAGGRHWTYNVMFQNCTIIYSEENLELVEKFDWKPAKPGVID